MFNITATGNLGRDPELKQIGEVQAAAFSLAVRTGKEETTWLNCTVFGPRSSIVMQFFKKGSKVCVSGRARTREYTTKDNVERTSLEVNVGDFDLPERREPTQQTFNTNDNF